jgi:hypothetical protein
VVFLRLATISAGFVCRDLSLITLESSPSLSFKEEGFPMKRSVKEVRLHSVV